jgi:O-methyltransferase involved in polyketide biosynthesis
VSKRRPDPRISPTAWFTGQVWVRNGLSVPQLDALQGQMLYHAGHPALVAMPRLLGLESLEDMLLFRHRTFDVAARMLVEKHGVRQGIEIASGLSARGIRMTRDYAGLGLSWCDADLPHMVQRKRTMLARGPALPASYRQRAVDVLDRDGELSMAHLFEDRSRPTAVFMEGLLNYFPREIALDICGRTSEQLRKCPSGWLVMEVHTRDDLNGKPYVGPFLAGLSAFARGRVSIHYDNLQEVSAELRARGFDHVVEVVNDTGTSGSHPLVRVIAASVGRIPESVTRTGPVRAIDT